MNQLSHKYKCLLFDADGTLFDYNAAELFALEKAFKKFQLAFSENELNLYRKINHQLWLDMEKGLVKPEILQNLRFEILFSNLNHSISAVEFNKTYLSFLGDCSDLLDGAFELLNYLDRNYKIAIVTNGLKSVQRRRLEKSTIKNFVDEIIISEEIGYAKPGKEYFDAVFAKLGYPAKDNVLIIGDSLTSDIKGGFDYGIDTCWFNPGGLENTYEIKPTFEILNLFQLKEYL